MKKFISLILIIALAFPAGVTVFSASEPETVTVSAENFTFESEDHPYGYILEPVTVEIESGDTAMDAIVRALNEAEISCNVISDETGEFIGGYISEVGGLSEMDGGSDSGWMTTVNDWFMSSGLESVYVSDGDVIALRYSMDWGADLGSDWTGEDTGLKSLYFEGGILSPEFDPEILEYELTLERGTKVINAGYEALNKNYQVRTYLDAEIEDGVIEGEADYEEELSGLTPLSHNLTRILGYYKNGKDIPAKSGSVITIACGLPGWTSMNAPGEGTIYTVTLLPWEMTDIEIAISELYDEFTAYEEQNPKDGDFQIDMSPQIIELYGEFLAVEDPIDVRDEYVSMMFEMLGAVAKHGCTMEIESVRRNSKIKFKLTSATPFEGADAYVRVTAVPNDGDGYNYEEEEPVVSVPCDLSVSSSEYTITVGEMEHRPVAKERLEFFIDFSYNDEVISGAYIDKTVVKESDSGGSGSGSSFGGSGSSGSNSGSNSNSGNSSGSDSDSGNSSGSDSDNSYTDDNSDTETEPPVDYPPEPVTTPSSPFVYFDVPPPVTGQEANFTDLEGFSWANSAISELVGRGVLNGTSADTFAPGENVTREQFVKMLVIAFDIEIPTEVIPNFTDVDSTAWYAPYVYAASYSGIVQGVEFDLAAGVGKFGVGEFISREDIVTLLWRAIGQPDSDYSPYYDDYDDVADYAKTAVALFTDEGSISGYLELEGTFFKPKAPASRAEAAQMLYNIK